MKEELDLEPQFQKMKKKLDLEPQLLTVKEELLEDLPSDLDALKEVIEDLKAKYAKATS